MLFVHPRIVDLYMQETIETLRLFEKDCMQVFLLEEDDKKHSSLEQRIRNLENK